MTELEGQIQYWEGVLKDTEYLLNPSVRALITGTLRHLKELQKLQGQPND